MACHLFDAKPLSKPMLDYCQLNTWEQTSVKFDQNTKLFIHENASETVICEIAAILSRGRCVKNVKPSALGTVLMADILSSIRVVND